MKMVKAWQTLLTKIKRESDPQVLHEVYHFEDNFAILLTVDSAQKESVEAMLETYPKGEYFEEELEAFKQKRYVVGDTVILYRPRRGPGIVEWFERDCGEETQSNANITFHAHGNSLAEQVINGKQAVLEIAGKLVELGVPFETARPASRYIP